MPDIHGRILLLLGPGGKYGRRAPHDPSTPDLISWNTIKHFHVGDENNADLKIIWLFVSVHVCGSFSALIISCIAADRLVGAS